MDHLKACLPPLHRYLSHRDLRAWLRNNESSIFRRTINGARFFIYIHIFIYPNIKIKLGIFLSG